VKCGEGHTFIGLIGNTNLPHYLHLPCGSPTGVFRSGTRHTLDEGLFPDAFDRHEMAPGRRHVGVGHHPTQFGLRHANLLKMNASQSDWYDLVYQLYNKLSSYSVENRASPSYAL